MNDAEFLFRETEKERKRMGYGAHNKKRGGGRYVRTPSDNLSEKERNAMNGECKTYNISQRMTWEEFKKMPNDLQEQHIDFLQRNFNFGIGSQTAKVIFGITPQSLENYLKKNGIKYEVIGKGSRVNMKKLRAWLAENEPVEEKTPEPENVPEKVCVEAKLEPSMAEALDMLLKLGAKITIQISL